MAYLQHYYNTDVEPLLLVLCTLLKASLVMGYIPNSWKEARMYYFSAVSSYAFSKSWTSSSLSIERTRRVCLPIKQETYANSPSTTLLSKSKFLLGIMQLVLPICLVSLSMQVQVGFLTDLASQKFLDLTKPFSFENLEFTIMWYLPTYFLLKYFQVSYTFA